jgi:hypothetical protein
MTTPVLTPRPGLIPSARLRAAELSQIVDDLALNPELWQSQLRFGANERWWTRLHHAADLDIWLLTWVLDTSTDLHDHGDSAGAFTVVWGVLEEVRPDARGRLTRTTVSAGKTREVERGQVHDVRSPSRAPAVSIHAYSPPLSEMTFYEPAKGGPRPSRTVRTRNEQLLP